MATPAGDDPALLAMIVRRPDWAVTEGLLTKMEQLAAEHGDDVGVHPSLLALFLMCYSGLRPHNPTGDEILERAQQAEPVQLVQFLSAVEAVRRLLGRSRLPQEMNGYPVVAAMRDPGGEDRGVVVCEKRVRPGATATEIANRYVVWTVGLSGAGWVAENGDHDIRYSRALVVMCERIGVTVDA